MKRSGIQGQFSTRAAPVFLDFAALHPGYTCWGHAIRDEEDYARHLDYVHYNPVKHGLVAAVAHWPYSTFHRWVQAGVYPAGWGGEHVADVAAGERA